MCMCVCVRRGGGLTEYDTLCHCSPDRGAPGCPRVHPDRNLSNHPHPNEILKILKIPWHPSVSPGCWGTEGCFSTKQNIIGKVICKNCKDNKKRRRKVVISKDLAANKKKK